MIFIVKTYHNRMEKPLDQKTIKIIGIACPGCNTSHRLTGKNVPGVDRRIVNCGLCGASFYEDEGRGNRK